MAHDADVVWIDRPEGLAALVPHLERVARFALDTEADGFHAYRPRLCLLQVAWVEPSGETGVALVDALALEGRLAGLGERIADPATAVVMHGADYDVRLMRRDAGLAPRGLIDTELAARLLGYRRTGLHALCEAFGIAELDKRQRRIDWGRRPLDPRALAYAAEDVRVLLPLAERLERELDQRGRRTWLEEESARRESLPAAPQGPADPADVLARVPGRGRLDARGRAVAMELIRWREGEAFRRGVPALRVLALERIVPLALSGARSREDLIRAGLPPGQVRRYGGAILAALGRGRRAPPVSGGPRAGRREGRDEAVDPETWRRCRAARDAAAETLGIEPGVLCPNERLRAAVARGAASEAALVEAGMSRWQAQHLAPALADILGRSARSGSEG